METPGIAAVRSYNAEITRELLRQIDLRDSGKFAETAADMARRGAMGDVLAVLVEEVGEVARAINDAKTENLRDELLQTAAVAISALNGLDWWIVHRQNGAFG